MLPERHVTAQAFTARFESRETGAATTFARYGGQAYSDSCGGERPLQPLVSTLISIDPASVTLLKRTVTAAASRRAELLRNGPK